MNSEAILLLVLKVIALAMGIASVVLSFFPKEANSDTRTTVLGIGLTALALAALL